MYGKDALDSKRYLGAAHDRANELVKLSAEQVSFWYGDRQVLTDVDLTIYDREVTAFIGPSGCGKSTLLRCFNRSNEIIDGTRMQGRVSLDGEDLYDPAVDPVMIRRRFGWVAQVPNPFPKSIHENLAYGARIRGMIGSKADADELVFDALTQAGLWDEVKDRLKEPGTALSGGQQQRLCIARALATRPEVILMDEPCSSLDPVATAHIEDLMERLRRQFTIVLVTHNLQQAARVSQRTVFLHFGRVVEVGDTHEVFTSPQSELCGAFITGRYG